MFSGGGYVIPVWTTRMLKMVQSLEKLHNASWVDEKTRVIFLEFTVFNPRNNLFASSVLIFKITDTGIIGHSDVSVNKVYLAATVDDIYSLVFEGIYLILIIVYIVKTVLNFWRNRHELLQLFSTLWPFIDYLIIMLTFALIPVIIWRQEVSRRTSRDIRNGNGKKFISFYHIFLSQVIRSMLLNCVHFLTMMNVLKWSVFLTKRNLLFAFNISRASTYVFYIAFLFLVVFVVTVLTSQVVFGSYCESYTHFTNAVLHIANLFRYNLVCKRDKCIYDSSGVNLVFFGFAAFFVVLTSRVLLLMCGITAQYTAEKRREKADRQFVHSLTCMLLVSTGYWTMDDYSAYMRSKLKRKNRVLQMQNWLNDLYSRSTLSSLSSGDTASAPISLSSGGSDRTPSPLSSGGSDRTPSPLSSGGSDRTPSSISSGGSDRTLSSQSSGGSDRTPSSQSSGGSDRTLSSQSSGGSERTPSSVGSGGSESMPSSSSPSETDDTST